jgi:tetratricopeptide (TPR) repeat protein
MKNHFLTLILLFSISCASQQNGQFNQVDGYSEEDLSWVRNEDFRPISTVDYNIREDFYMESLSSDDSLKKESIERAPKNVLNRIENSDDLISKLASLCYQREDRKASSLMDEMYGRYKKNPAYWNQIGTCYLNSDEHQRAELFYNKALDEKKDYAPAVNNLGVIYYREQRYQKAMSAFEKASGINRFSLTPSFNLAQLYLKFGFIDKAADIFKALWRQSNTDTDVVNALATIFLLRNQIDQSLRLYSGLGDSELRKPEYGLNYAVALKMANRTDEAFDVLNDLQSSRAQSLSDYHCCRMPGRCNQLQALAQCSWCRFPSSIRISR